MKAIVVTATLGMILGSLITFVCLDVRHTSYKLGVVQDMSDIEKKQEKTKLKDMYEGFVQGQRQVIRSCMNNGVAILQPAPRDKEQVSAFVTCSDVDVTLGKPKKQSESPKPTAKKKDKRKYPPPPNHNMPLSLEFEA